MFDHVENSSVPKLTCYIAAEEHSLLLGLIQPDMCRSAVCDASQVVRSYSYVLTWMSISISVILFNKWLLAFSGFPYPIALTSWHMLFCSVVGFLCVRVFRVVKSHNMTRDVYVRRVLPIGGRPPPEPQSTSKPESL